MPPPNQPFYRDEHLLVDLRDQVVMLDSQILTLTRMEYGLLALLVEHAGEIVPRPILLMRTRMADMHIRRLRKKLGIHVGRYIETIGGIGYSFRPTPWPCHQDLRTPIPSPIEKEWL